MSAETGLVLAIVLDGRGGGRELDWDGVRAWEPSQGVLWVHLDYTHPGTRLWLEREANVDPILAEALLAEETRPRCGALGDGTLLSLRGVNSNPGADPEDMVSIRLFSTRQRVISTRRRRLLSIRDVRDALAQGRGPGNSGELVALLADRLTDRMGDVINMLEERIDTLEERVVEGAGQEVRPGILELRREIIKLRRYLAPQREALARLASEPNVWMDESDRVRVREALDRVSRYLEELDSARDRAAVAHEELAGRQAEQMNTRMYLLSVIAALFLPMGFLTGLLGINVGGIPLAESPWGFVLVSVGLVVILAGQVWVFRRNRWF
ncbi:MAG: zinc transporter ZntB [Gammaproteobacteria bacterium]